MKCEKCDVELVWLYKPLQGLYFTHRDEDFTATDYLMCPICEKICYPDAKTSNGTIIYNRGAYAYVATNRRFEIDINGELVE